MQGGVIQLRAIGNGPAVQMNVQIQGNNGAIQIQNMKVMLDGSDSPPPPAKNQAIRLLDVLDC